VVHGQVTYPLNTYSLDLGLQYKGWALSVKSYGVSDINKHLDPLVLWDNWNGQRGQYKAWPNVTERWTPENAGSAEKPALHSEHIGYSRSTSTYTYRSASYVRLKNVELSYHFQEKLLNKIGLKRLQVYANGNNLYTWSSLPDKIDPEARGAGIHPLVKRMNVGFRASF